MPRISSLWLLVRTILFHRRKDILTLPMDRTYSIHYSSEVDEEADEVLEDSIIEEIWFDDILTEELPDHLNVSLDDDGDDEPYDPKTQYLLDCERGLYCSYNHRNSNWHERWFWKRVTGKLTWPLFS